MDILIPDQWLREYLKTKANNQEIKRCLSLMGPSVEKITKYKNEPVYNIEITTNRIDLASIIGLAKEAAAILPRFGHKTSVCKLKTKPIRNQTPLDIKIINNSKLCKRILAVKLKNVKISDSPGFIKKRLEMIGQRPLNNIIDITNYVMWETGHPLHAFDYDKITTKKIIIREAKKGEQLITFDKRKVNLLGGEVIFDDGTGRIIDFPGICGTKNTVITKDTKNVLLWIESIIPSKIRFGSMAHSIRTHAASINEKGPDPELGKQTILRAKDLMQKYAKADLGSGLFDLYKNPYSPKKIIVTHKFLTDKLGIEIPRKEIENILLSLDFGVTADRDSFLIKVPSSRSSDIEIPEDILEEVARMYGYHNLPSQIMDGAIPPTPETSFEFEKNLKSILKGLGGIEIYTLSLVDKNSVNQKTALKLKNPLSSEFSYLRTSLRPSLIKAANENRSQKDPFHLYELANIYLKQSNSLPKEQLKLAGIFVNYDFRKSKGIVEEMLNELNISYNFKKQDANGFAKNKRVIIKKLNAEFGELESGQIYYEFDFNKLYKLHSPLGSFKPIPKYPPQIEDLTFLLPDKTIVGEVLSKIKHSHKFISKTELKDIYKNNYTFRIWYQNPQKTLTDKEVEKIRNIIIKAVQNTFGAQLN